MGENGDVHGVRRGGSSDLLAAATARVSAIQAYYLAYKESIQTHGGMGYTWEFD